jgi:hypothetical protein
VSRRLVPILPIALALSFVLAACGDGLPPVEDTSQVPLVPTGTDGDGTGSPTLSPTPPSDEEFLSRKAQEVADAQRPGEFVAILEITLFDDPEGCESGEAALVSMEFSAEPTPGQILFCRVDEEPGWVIAQAILYGE